MDTCPNTSELLGKTIASRKLIAVVHMDMVGYSHLIGLDDEGTVCRFADIRATLIDPAVAEHGGRIVQTAGDSLLIVFDSIDGAVGCAIKVQQEIPLYDEADLPGQCIRFRIGIEIGDVIAAGAELHGNGINVAARLQAICNAGGICVSRVVRDHVRHRPDLAFERLGALRLKNIARPVEAFLLHADPSLGLSFGALPRPGAVTASVAERRPHPVLTLAQIVPAWREIGWPRMAGHGASRMLAVGALLVPLLLPWTDWRMPPREQAERFLRQGLTIACTHPCPRAWLAERTLYRQAIAADPTFARPYAEAVFTYTNFITSHLSVDRDDDFRQAARLATEAVALAPDEPFAYEARAAVLRQDQDRLEDALSAYLRALALAPNLARVRANAGWMLVLLGRPAEAEPYLRNALAADPGNMYASAWLNYLGIAELFLGRYGDSAGLFQEAIAREAQRATAEDIAVERELNLAAALALDGDVGAARKVIDALRPQHPTLSTNNVLGNCTCSHAPGFLTGLAKLRRGAAMAGVFDAG